MQITVIQKKIFEIRGQKVILDFHLAELYEVETRQLKQAVKRNINRFPPDFMFELTDKELRNLRSQIVISSWGGMRYGLDYKELEKKITALEKKYKKDTKQIFATLEFLLEEKEAEIQQHEDFKNRPRIGFKQKEKE